MGPWSDKTSVLTRRDTHTEKRPCGDMVGKQSGHLQAEERTSPETSSASTLSLGFQHPEPWRKILLLFKLPSLWYFVKVALGNWYAPETILYIAFFPTFFIVINICSIKFTILRCTVQWHQLHFTLLYNHHHHVVTEFSIFPYWSFVSFNNDAPLPPPPAPGHHFPSAKNVTTVGPSCKQRHTVLALSLLAYFT